MALVHTKLPLLSSSLLTYCHAKWVEQCYPCGYVLCQGLALRSTSSAEITGRPRSAYKRPKMTLLRSLSDSMGLVQNDFMFTTFTVRDLSDIVMHAH